MTAQLWRESRQVVLNMFNQALATELVCVLRYRRHYFMAHGATERSCEGTNFCPALGSRSCNTRTFWHERIVQLGGQAGLQSG